MNSAEAEAILDRAVAYADELGVTVCVAVVDAAAHLLAFRRMDSAILGAIDVAQRKARTAALFPMETGEFGDLICAEKLVGMELSNHGLAAFPGGLTILRGGVAVGAIGISGATAEQDRAIARVAVEHAGQY